MKKRYIVIIAVLAVFLIGSAAGVMAYQKINEDLKQLAETPIDDVDLSHVADGTYFGAWSTFPVAVEVRVTVKDHAITDIRLVKHDNGKGSAAEVIPDIVVAKQSLKVDTVTGATYSSKAILKATENALNNAGK